MLNLVWKTKEELAKIMKEWFGMDIYTNERIKIIGNEDNCYIAFEGGLNTEDNPIYLYLVEAPNMPRRAYCLAYPSKDLK